MKRTVIVLLTLAGCSPQPPDEASTEQAFGSDGGYTGSGAISPAPGTPTLLSRTDASLSMQYTCAGNAFTHEVWRRRNGDTSFSKVGSSFCSGAPQAFSDSDVQPETNYCYRVRANNTTNIAWSGTACFTTRAPTVAPTRPPLWLESRSTTSIRAVWRDDAKTESYYRVWRRTATTAWVEVNYLSRRVGSDLANRTTGEELSFTDSGLAPQTRYTYFVEVGYDPVDPALATLVSSSLSKETWTRDATVPSSLGCTSNVQFDCDSTIQLSSGMRLTVYRNFDLASPNQNITRVVAVVHGHVINPWIAFGAVTSAAATEGLGGSTLVVAPLFEEANTTSPNLSWDGGWREGGTSRAGNVSSFDAMDELLRHVTDPAIFPNVRTVVAVGHSAGGQFIDRYAATTPLGADLGVPIRFITANPSHYLYLNNVRPDGSGGFKIPSGITGYDDYPYGIKNRNEYASRISDTQLRNNANGRAVIYLLGDQDLNTASTPNDNTSLVITPQANIQGASRWERGNNFYRFMQTYYPGHYGRLIPVPGIGHDPVGMYTSLAGRGAIFY